MYKEGRWGYSFPAKNWMRPTTLFANLSKMSCGHQLVCGRSVWPDGFIIRSIFGHLLKLKFGNINRYLQN